MTRFRLDPGQIEVVDPSMAEILRSKTPAQKFQMVVAAHRSMRKILSNTIKADHPEWTEQQIARAVAARMSRGSR